MSSTNPMKAKTLIVGSMLLIGPSVVALSGSGVSNKKPSSSLAETKLCAALEEIKDGEELQVTISGIYEAGYEMRVFYDPDEPVCQEDVQPSTWIAFDSSASGNSTFDRLVQKDRRAYVTFRGKLHGPAAIPPDDPSLPTYASYANRVKARHYGHLNIFRTELVVDNILEARPVPKTILSGPVWQRPVPMQYRLAVLGADIPSYPEMAQTAGISGEVEVEVKVAPGKPIETEVKSGDRLLAVGAVANIRTWKFGTSVIGTFVTKFVYRLERRETKANGYSRVDLQLPYRVEIVSPTFDW